MCQVRGWMPATQAGEARGVGAVAPAHHDHHVDAGGQLLSGRLALAGGVADGVEDERLAGHGGEARGQARQVVAGLRGLHDHPDALAGDVV